MVIKLLQLSKQDPQDIRIAQPQRVTGPGYRDCLHPEQKRDNKSWDPLLPVEKDEVN